jgi:signal transduction histidine kinase
VQVVSNLLHNAVEVHAQHGHISVRLTNRRHSANAEIRVQDDGPGIARQDLQRIFELFVQGEQGTARPQGRPRPGLSLVQQLTTLHGGGQRVQHRPRPAKAASSWCACPSCPCPTPWATPNATATRSWCWW